MANKKLWSILLCLALIMSFGTTALADEPANGVVKVYFWYEPSETDLKAIAYTEDKYQIKVDWEYVAWANIDTRNQTDITGGDSPDLMMLHTENFPRVAVQNLIVPVSSLNQELYNNPVLARAAAGVRNHFSFNGEGWAVGGSGNPRWLIYNKTMFEDLGMDTPLELYEAGEWNWDTFKQSAIDIMDYDEEGNTTVWGFEAWIMDLWVLSNNSDFLAYPDEGIELALDTPETVAGLQFMQDAYFKDKFISPDASNTYESDFVSGKCAMIADGAYKMEVCFMNMKDEFDFVPFPAGPANTEGYVPGNFDGWAICAGAKNPDGALMYLIGMAEYAEEHKDDPVTGWYANFTEEQLDRMDLYAAGGPLNDRIVASTIQGIGNLRNLQWGFWDEVRAGTPIASIIETHAPTFNAEIAATLADTKVKVVEPFNALPVIDFEAETAACATSDTQHEIVDDGIDGKSMKITRDRQWDWQMVARTVPENWFFPSYGHSYKVTFDYKMLNDMDEGGYFYVCMRPVANIGDGAVNFGWTTSSTMKAGDEGTFEAYIGVDQASEPLCVIIGGFRNGDMLIDNIQIVEAN